MWRWMGWMGCGGVVDEDDNKDKDQDGCWYQCIQLSSEQSISGEGACLSDRASAFLCIGDGIGINVIDMHHTRDRDGVPTYL